MSSSQKQELFQLAALRNVWAAQQATGSVSYFQKENFTWGKHWIYSHFSGKVCAREGGRHDSFLQVYWGSHHGGFWVGENYQITEKHTLLVELKMITGSMSLVVEAEQKTWSSFLLCTALFTAG